MRCVAATCTILLLLLPIITHCETFISLGTNVELYPCLLKTPYPETITNKQVHFDTQSNATYYYLDRADRVNIYYTDFFLLVRRLSVNAAVTFRVATLTQSGVVNDFRNLQSEAERQAFLNVQLPQLNFLQNSTSNATSDTITMGTAKFVHVIKMENFKGAVGLLYVLAGQYETSVCDSYQGVERFLAIAVIVIPISLVACACTCYICVMGCIAIIVFKKRQQSSLLHGNQQQE